MEAQTFLDNFGTIADAPGGMDRLRERILDLAISGRLVEQRPTELPVSPALAELRAGKGAVLSARVKGRSKVPREPESWEVARDTPTGWCWARIDDTGEYINGLSFKQGDWQDAGLPIIRIQNLTNPNAEFNYARGSFPEDRTVDDGDILVSWSATLEAFVWDRGPAVVNQHIFKVIPELRVVAPGFLYHLLRHTIRDLADSDAAHGLAMKHINRGPFVSHVVGIPPLAEQERIVSKIDELMQLCDDLEACQQVRHHVTTRLRSSSLEALTNADTDDDLHAAWSRLQTNWEILTDHSESIESLRGTILGLAVRGRLSAQNPGDEPASSLLSRIHVERQELPASGRIKKATKNPGAPDAPFALPETWAWVRLGSVAEMRYGTSAKSRPDGTVPVLRMGNLQSGEIDWTNLKYTSDEAEIAKYHLPSPAVLFNRTNSKELVGKTAIYRGERPAIFAGYLIHVQCSLGLEPEYLNLVLNTPMAKSWCWAIKTDGISQSNISASKLAEFPFPLAPLDEQRRIAKRVSQLLDQCAGLSRALDTRHKSSALLSSTAVAMA